MHSVRSAGRPLPFSPFGQAHGSSSDPLRFPLNLNLSDESCNPSLRAPYLSPPMSGSPSPESRFDPLLRDRRRRGSDSLIPSPVRGNVQPLLSYAEPPATSPGPDAPLPDSRRLSAGQPAMSVIGLPAIDDTQLRHTLQTGPLLPPRASPLPPRSTRRAKAHVASACVNCKRKHLGCDSARPCRRCISAGKEESCVDVRHKRRGRPPLKAEEGPIQTYEPTYSYPGASHPQPESSSPVPPFYGHRRTSSSREIRPNTELQVSRRSSEIGSEYGRLMAVSAMPNPQMWAPVTPLRTMHTSPSISNAFPGQMSFPSSSQQSHAHNVPLFSAGAGSSSAYIPDYRDMTRSVHPFPDERIPPNQSPRQYQRPHIPPLPRGSTYFSGPGSPHGPLSSPPLSASSSARNYPFPGPGQSQILLPPLIPSKTGSDFEFEFSQSSRRPPGALPPSLPSIQSGRPNLSRVEHAKELEDPRPLPAHPPFQPTTFSSGPPIRGLLDPYRPLPVPPQPLPHGKTTPQGQLSTSASHNLAPTLDDESSPAMGRERGSPSRPVKRQKMALGDMVND
ncbi:C6 transcription factor [Histoplasma capsulatum G186AR]|nr:C6 transcription factor [Histoplasma capsulatum]QSS75544.1 C6 transcription factor [Histoplasma capsulatum G186AR]